MLTIATMQHLVTQPGYTQGFAIRLYERNGKLYANINPVCSIKYNFAVYVNRLHVANDN